MSEKFTKGPWISVEGNTSGREVLAEKPSTKSRRRVARIGGPDRDANAHLIAAAPELYEALEVALEQAIGCFQNHYGEDPSTTPEPEYIQKARAALAKARGETP